jgi:hypothetical protein
VTDFPLLAADLQRHYLQRGIVQAFIVRALEAKVRTRRSLRDA